ncbi:MAG: hypothetical protein AAGJ18_31400 [Bacteroidota bacterium]
MGHNIDIVSKKNEETIAGIQFGAFNSIKAGLIYRSLDAEIFNMGVSGSGDSREYSKADLEVALRKLKYLCGEPMEAILDTDKDDTRNLFLQFFGTSMQQHPHDSAEMKKMYQECAPFLQKAIASEAEDFIIEFY